jgi:phytoene dehydrogenase-like protein
MLNTSYDGVVVGSGPNGLAAAIRLAQERLSVLLIEANDSIGGGIRSAELTLPGFIHDVSSAVHPLGVGSPFFRRLPLESFGLTWLQPELPLAHPLDDSCAAILQRSVTATAAELGADQSAYERLMAPLASNWENLTAEFLRPLLHLPRHPVQLGLFGWHGLQSAARLVDKRFAADPARALFGGLAAHSFLPLEKIPSAAYGLVLGMLGHSVGWPMARGGAQKIADALASVLRSLGGEILPGCRIDSLSQLPKSRVIILDVTPRQLLRIAGDKLPLSYQRRLGQFRYGPGIFKIDYALNGPIPWAAQACSRAGTIHVGGRFEEIATAERAVAQGQIPERPFILLAQPSLFDTTRAPQGRHTAWAYCHVPNGSSVDMTPSIERQIERFAPGFRDQILARHTTNCAQLELANANLVGGDINGGSADLWQMVSRPILSPAPYRTPVPGLYLCSSSTPPGGGVHGMCGFHAAQTALRDCFR